MRFVATARFKSKLESIRNDIMGTRGSNALRQLQFYAVTGPMGVGKTTLAERLVLALAKEFKGLPLSVRISDLVTVLGRAVATYTPDDLLAAALFRALFPGHPIPAGLALSAVCDAVRSNFKVGLVFIDLDEFQKDSEVTRGILGASMFSFDTGRTLSIYPIASGIWPVDASIALLRDPKDTSSESLVREIDLSFAEFVSDPAALNELYASFLAFAELPETLACDVLRQAFDDCGGFGHLVRALAAMLKRQKNKLVNLYAGRRPLLSYPQASDVLQAVATALAYKEYSDARWHQIVRLKGGEEFVEGKVTERDSWTQSTRLVMVRVVLCILTDRKVDLNARILPDDGGANPRLTAATYKDAAKTGLMGLDGNVLIAPPLWVRVMCQHADVLPFGVNDIIDPFKNDDNSHEKLALATLFFRLLATHVFGDALVPVASLRPGADAQGALLEGLTLRQAAAEPALVFRTRFLASPGPEKLLAGHVQMAAKNEPGLDGWALFEVLLNSAPVLVLWLSQSKWRTAVVGSKGVAATSAVMRSSEAQDYLDLMIAPSETLLAQVEAEYPNRKVVRAFDLFTTHIGPVRGFKELVLPENSVAFMTTSETFKTVVGRTFAVRRRAEREVAEA